MASITLTVDEWQALQRRASEAEHHAVQLQNKISEAQMTSNPLVPILLEGFLSAYELVKFCIAHAHPEIVKTQPWPHEALLGFAAVLEQIPASPEASGHNKEAAIDMRDMAKEAERWNTVRAERKLALGRGELSEFDRTHHTPADNTCSQCRKLKCECPTTVA